MKDRNHNVTVGIDLWPHNVSNYAHTHTNTHTLIWLAGSRKSWVRNSPSGEVKEFRH